VETPLVRDTFGVSHLTSRRDVEGSLTEQLRCSMRFPTIYLGVYSIIRMQNDLMNQLFGPMDKFYCLWFLYLSIFGFVLFTVAVLTFLVLAITKKRSGQFYFQMFMVAMGYFVFYFQNRLLHSMCVNTIKM